MKVRFLLIVFLVSAFNAIAGTTIISGELGILMSTRLVPVKLVWEEAVYGKAGNLQDFLDTAERAEDWEERSLRKFLFKSNAETAEYGVKLISYEESKQYIEYWLEFKPLQIKRDGDISGEIRLFSLKTASPIAIIEFKSDERDDNDEIAFADQFESIGESFGRMFAKQLKKANKTK